MKRFTSILFAALIAVVSYAQKPVQLTRAAMLKGEKLELSNLSVAKFNSSVVKKSLKKAPRKAPASLDEIAGTYKWIYETSSETAVDPSTLTNTSEGSANVTITVDDENDVLVISGMFTNDLEATYDADYGCIVIEGGQLAGTSSYGDYVLQGLFYYEGDETYPAGWYYSDIYGYIQDDGTIYFTEWFCRVLSGGQYDGYSLTPYYVAGSYLEPSEPLVPVEAPEGLETDEYVVTYKNSSDEDASGSVNIGFDGTDVYIQGLSNYLPEAWLKGTLSGNIVTIAAQQYMGSYAGYDSFMPYEEDDVTLIYDEESGTFTAEVDFYGVLGGQYYDGYYAEAVFKKVTEKAATPANPSITALSNSSYGYIIEYSVPNVDTNGDGLVASKLSYIFYTDIEHTVSPLTFTPETHSKLTEEMTEIPFGFSENYDFENGYLYLNDLYSADWNKIGIKSIYRGGGEEHETEIQWFTIKKYAEEIAREALETEVAAATALKETNEAAGKTEGIADFEAAIAAANAVLDKANASADELNAAVEALQTAETTFRNINMTEDERNTATVTWTASSNTTTMGFDNFISGAFAAQAAYNRMKYVTFASGNTFTIASSGRVKKISEIVVTYSGTNYVGEVTASEGEYAVSEAVGTWTGEATEVTFTATADARIKSIAVTYVKLPTKEIAGAKSVDGEKYYTTLFDAENGYASDDASTKIYTAQVVKGEYLKLAEVAEAPAGNAVIIETTAETFALGAIRTVGTLENNDLKGAATETAVESGKTYYVLGAENSKVGFYKFAGTTLAAGKAYIELAGDAAVKVLGFDEATGISTVEVANAENGAIYNLAGQRMNKAQKGVFIVNGKKVVLK